MFRKYCCKKKKAYGNSGSESEFELSEGRSESLSLLLSGAPDNIGDEDDDDEPFDVAKEREKVYRNAHSDDCPIVIVNLRKIYKSKGVKVAVKRLTIAIEKGECFGLLGPNGAGKSTTISMLTGLFPPTSGYARVGGFDIRNEIDLVHRVMGVCPQFDTLWMDLTCEETLLFYSRLKGIGRKEETAHVAESLEQVGLGDVPKRKVGDLSGGMRRRLSVAIALVGNPRIVFLDEPTTGLDPESRRKLWDVLMAVKKGKCLILTTHSMEEADVLCTKLGIMSNGSLQCVGKQHDLKKRFGQGYTLKVTFAEKNKQRVEKFVAGLYPRSTIVEEYARSLTWQIPRADVIISEMFVKMTKDCKAAGVEDWGVNETSLEDVFLNIVRTTET
eukprot:TRINITY_DN1151_c0_g1_i2.p1 TRINITY_DN1151_c0_g1~~TRINITY_DN1151_c0_g1_i2.p1  ORF type:complete len:386 (+),score=71.03 TRINITY_DN1151_c0_g1_i2:1036-2193(+)